MTNVAAGSDVLTDALFSVTDRGGTVERLSLSRLLARLLSGPEVSGFPSVGAEQRGHWWRFLVRCAAKAFHERDWNVQEAARLPPTELAQELRDTLRASSGDPDGSRGVWALYQPDPAQPGFLQAPTPDGQAPEQSKYSRNTMSLLTSAIGSKSHERKVDCSRTLDAEQAVYALIEIQLGAIFGGRGNYASQIMGSASGAGSGSPFMGARLGSGENETFQHDVGVLLDSWEHIRNNNGLRGTIWSLWTERWDGESSLPSQRMEPAFIPLARLIRLGAPGVHGEFDTAWFRASKKARVEDLTGGGNMGDPFTPLVPDLKNPEVLKVRGTLQDGYGYAEVANLLFGTDAKRPGTPSPSVGELQQALHDGRPDVRALFEGTAYEQGKTVGFYRREVLLPATADSWLGDPNPIRVVHSEMIQRVREVKSALNGAARILLSGEPKPHEGDVGKISLPADHLDAVVDRIYIESLLDAAELHQRANDGWRIAWVRRLEPLALESFHETMSAIPTATARHYEREVRALSWLERRLRGIRGDAGDTDATIPLPPSLEEIPA